LDGHQTVKVSKTEADRLNFPRSTKGGSSPAKIRERASTGGTVLAKAEQFAMLRQTGIIGPNSQST
jgi:hypothetical protein